MWWKIGLLAVATAGLIFCIIPVQTHAVLFDPANPASKRTLWAMVSNMHLTSGTLLMVVVIIAVASAIGFWIVRSA